MRNKKGKNKPYKSILQHKIDWKKFNSSNTYRKNVLQYIKNYQYEHNPIETLKFLKNLPFLCKKLLTNDLLNKDIKQLNNSTLGYFIDDIENNLLQMLNVLSLYTKEIECFLINKKTFEKQFLLGEITDSNKILESTIKKFGYTNWYLSNKFLIEEHLNRFEGNFKLLRYITEFGANHPLNYIFSFSFSRLVEQDLAIDNYKKSLKLDCYKYYNVSKNLKEFLKVYTEPLDIYESNNLNGIFIGEVNSSLIDQYLTFKKILVNLLENNPIICSKILTKAKSLFYDSQLKKIQFLLDGNIDFFKFDEETKSTFFILDLYTEGKYNDCIRSIKSHILKFEISIDLIEIYVKSYINLNLEIELLTENDSFLNYISKHIYNILFKNNETEESINKLRICSYSLRNFDISLQLCHFVNKFKQSSDKKSFDKEHQIFLPVITPKVIHHFVNESIKINILNVMNIKNSKTVEFFKQLLTFNKLGSLNVDSINIPETRLLLNTSLILFRKKEYETVINNLQPLLEKLTNIPHTYENYLYMIYESYSKLENYQKCINLYVDNYFKNKYLLNNIKTSSENKFISNLGYKELEINIDLILFIHICKIESKVLFLLYRLFMREINTKKPSLISIESFSLNKIVYFLRYVCVPEVLSKDAINFKSTYHVESERLKICQLLVSIDSSNSRIYNEEITEITQNINIRERMREIDNGKIHVDIKGLINYDLKDFNRNFSRFKRVKDVSEDIYKIVTDNDSIEGDIQDYRKKIVTQEEQLWNIYIELFIEIRNKYLFSNEHGLDSYLSTRIRHGTITSQFRKVFDELKLITKKDSKLKSYQDNLYWKNKIALEKDEELKFNLIMNKFSADIDDYILFIKDFLIQIRTENLSEALFNFNIYVYSNFLRQQFKEFMNINEGHEFINESIKICNYITDVNLERIKIFFEDSIKKHFFNLINDLEIKITEINCSNNLLPVLSNIRKSRTEIQTNIKVISAWFVRKETKSVNFTLSDVIETNKEIANNIYKLTRVNIHLNNNNSDLFEGKYFIDFVDCFKIFFENIINYSQKKNEDEANIFINIKDNEDYFVCEILNKLVNSTDEELFLLDQKIEEKKKEISEATKSIANRTEGNTGIIKATKILKRALGNNSNTIEFKRDDLNIVIEFKILKKGLVYEDSNN